MEKTLIINTFSDLEKVQKVSITNFLLALALCEGEKEIFQIRNNYSGTYNSYL
jgi:hypothetical protein